MFSSQQNTIADYIGGETSVNSINYNIPYQSLTSANACHLITSTSMDVPTANMVKNWKGPFTDFQNFYVKANTSITSNYFLDFPKDPWGNYYLFYSPKGITGAFPVGGLAGADPTLADFDGTVNTGDPGRFDRWAIVSWGPNGVPDTSADTTNGTADDVYYQFGFLPAPLTSDTGTSHP
jgi:hypothetical protein